MNHVSKTLLVFVLLLMGFGPAAPARQSVFAQQVQATTWQDSATGLSVQNNDQKTAGLAYIITAPQNDWPMLALQGGTSSNGQYLTAAGGVSLGQVRIPGASGVSLTNQGLDWSHNQLTYSTSAGAMQVWASRLTPAVRIQSSASAMQLLTSAAPQYVAYSSGGQVRVQSLSAAPNLNMDQNWLLVWSGTSSTFSDTLRPLSYTGYDFDAYGHLPASNAFQADSPQLLVFQNPPNNVRVGSGGGMEIRFAQAAGNMVLMPLFGRKHPAAATTQAWSASLPGNVTASVRWWAQRLCKYPVKATETYAYQPVEDIAVISESFQYLDACAGGIPFAPLPPALAIAKDALGLTFSANMVNTNMPLEAGPYWGADNVSGYTWQLAGIREIGYVRKVSDNGAPDNLQKILDAQVNQMIQAGHMAPWIFSDAEPRSVVRGDIYWLNPADEIYHLVEIGEALPDGATRENLKNYLRNERKAYPPEDVANLPLDQGTMRPGYSIGGQNIFQQWREQRTDLFLKTVHLYNFYGLSRYYDFTGDDLPASVWQKASQALDRNLAEQDWASMYWLQGFEDRRIAVVNANRQFAGILGYVHLAQRAGDNNAEDFGYAYLAKAAALRLSMALYPQYLYQAGLADVSGLPTDWQVRYSAGDWYGYLFNYNWSSAADDIRQVVFLNQFGVTLFDHAGIMKGTLAGSPPIEWLAGPTSAYQVMYRDAPPELIHLLATYAPDRVQTYNAKVQQLFPQWYVAFREATLGIEHNLAHPSDSFQLLMANSVTQTANADQLAIFADIPWLQTGDLFYMHKIAEALKNARGFTWDSSSSGYLRAYVAAGNGFLQFSWNVLQEYPNDAALSLAYRMEPDGAWISVPNIPIADHAYRLENLENYHFYQAQLTLTSQGKMIWQSVIMRRYVTDIIISLPFLHKNIP